MHPDPGRNDAHAFAVGQRVRLEAMRSLGNAGPGPYTVVALLPRHDGEYQYRIKSDSEPYHRVTREGQLKRA